MERLPDSLAIALWVVGACWTVAIVAYVFGVFEELILPLVALGIVTGLAEWYLRQSR
jgi:pheromone shutdown protein TraB